MASRPVRAAVAAALCLGLSACGSSGGKSVVAPPPSPTAQPVTASPTPTTSGSASPGADSAKKLTAAGVLVAADVPGFTGEPAQTGDDKATEDTLYKCLGLSSPKFLDRNPGSEFSKNSPDTDVDTSADVVESAAEARDLARAAQGSAGPGCYQTYFQSLFTAEGDQLSGLTVTPVTVQVPGSDSVFALHVAGATTGSDGGPFDTYLVTAAYGQTEITINYTVNGSAKASPDDAARLAEVVVKRVKAAAG